jgi:siderophore synthetase component
VTSLLTNSPQQRAHDEALSVLLRCWLRETAGRVARPGPTAVPLPATGRTLVVDVRRASPTGQHALGRVTTDGRDAGLDDVARLLLAEAAAAAGLPAAHGDRAVARVLDSARRTARYATARAQDPEAPHGLPRWLKAEQDLVAGHPFHPMAKSREGLADADDDVLAPELRGRFPLHWYAARREVVTTGSAGLDVERLLRGLAADVRVPDGLVPVPAHPWQAARLRARPAAAALLDTGDLLDLGPAGPSWWPTSSVRTVGSPDTSVMLKLSLGLRVTNSRRDNVRSELTLGTRTRRTCSSGSTPTAARTAGGTATTRAGTSPRRTSRRRRRCCPASATASRWCSTTPSSPSASSTTSASTPCSASPARSLPQSSPRSATCCASSLTCSVGTCARPRRRPRQPSCSRLTTCA